MPFVTERSSGLEGPCFRPGRLPLISSPIPSLAFGLRPFPGPPGSRIPRLLQRRCAECTSLSVHRAQRGRFTLVSSHADASSPPPALAGRSSTQPTSSLSDPHAEKGTSGRLLRTQGPRRKKRRPPLQSHNGKEIVELTRPNLQTRDRGPAGLAHVNAQCGHADTGKRRMALETSRIDPHFS